MTLWLLLTILLGFTSKLDQFCRVGNRFWIYFKHKECIHDFSGINFAYPSCVTADFHCVAHFLARRHEKNE